MGRKPLSLKTKLASALLALGDIAYDDAKQMTADQLISLYHFDHNMLYESGHPQRDMYWNITPRLIKAHRDKTRRDMKIIAKSRRIRDRRDREMVAAMQKTLGMTATADYLREERKRGIRSRGFDKRYRRHLDGAVTKR